MRLLIAAYITLATPSVPTQLAHGQPSTAPGKAGKAHAAHASGAAIPRAGVKTPGVQIPFALLKAEAQLQFAPAWTAVTDALIASAPNGLIKIDQHTNQPGDPVKIASNPCGGAASGFNSLWVIDCGAGAIVRLDSKTWQSVAQLAAGAGSAEPAIAVTSDSVWAITDGKTTLSRIDPDQNQIVSQMRFEAGCSSLTFASSALWLLCPSENRLYRINPETNVVEKHIELSPHPVAVAFGENSLWALCLKDGKIDRIDPKTNKVTKTIELETPAQAGGIAVGSGSVWIALQGFPLTRIDAASEKVVQQFWGDGGGAIQFAFNSIWLTNIQEGTLWRIDPKRVAATLAE